MATKRKIDTTRVTTCDCADKECPAHKGETACRTVGRTKWYRRVDMDGGVRFCGPCADDALESGLFA